MDRSDWVEWHRQYDDEASPLGRRLAVVQARLDAALRRARPGAIRLVSACAGDGRDVIGVLAAHPRRLDVTARLIELDPTLAGRALARAAAAGLANVEVVEGDASDTSTYAGAVPADVVLLCGIFGNVGLDAVERTISTLPALCAPGATVIWTRHRRPPDVTPLVRGWFGAAGFAELAFDRASDVSYGVGTNVFAGKPRPLLPGVRLFSFTGDGSDADR